MRVAPWPYVDGLLCVNAKVAFGSITEGHECPVSSSVVIPDRLATVGRFETFVFENFNG